MTEPADGDRSVADVTIPARDQSPLAGTLFRPRNGGERGVIIGSAMGVRRGFYARYAMFLRQQGFTVLTFDYRGFGASADLDLCRPALHEWGELDLPAAIDWLEERCAAGVAVVAHSVSSQLLALADNNQRLKGIVLVAPQSGYWQLWDGFYRKILVAGAWYVGIPVLTRLFGKLPGWTFGGADLPAEVAREWAAWGRRRDYILSYRRDTRQGFARMTAPLMVYGIADDAFAPRRAVDAIAGWYGSTSRERRTLIPEASAPIGHFGFFSRRLAAKAWQESAGWLKNAT